MKHKLLIFIILLVLVLTNSAQDAGALSPDEQNLRLLSSSEKGISFEVRVPWQEADLQEVVIDGSTYTKISLPGWNAIGQAGAPELPVLTATFAVPFGAELSLEVSIGKSHLMKLDQSILPIAEQVFEQPDLFDPSLPTSPTQRLIYHPDEAIYTAEGAFPGAWAEITNEGIFRNQRLVGITVYPFQYQAQNNLLEIYESVTVDIIFEGENLSSTMSSVKDSEIFENLYEQTIINYESSIPWRGTELDSDLSTQGSLNSNQIDWNVPSPGWRVNVKEEGIYKLTYPELEDANMPVDILNLSDLQMFYMGSEIAIQIIDDNGDGDFDPEDLIIFFATKVDNKYAAENVYWLTYSNDSQELRMGSRDVSPDPEPLSPIAEDFTANLHFEENLNYASSIPGLDELDRFVWGFISTGYSGYRQKTFEFNLPEKSAGASETLKLALIGYSQIPTNPLDHRAVVKINGATVADSTWDGREWNILDIPLPTNLLTEGINQLEISSPNVSFDDAYYIDWFEIGIDQKFVAESDLLDFGYPEIGARQFLISEFSTADLVAFDISDINNPIRLTGMNIQNVDVNSFDVHFEDEITADTRYWVSAKSNFLSPTAITEDSVSDLSNPENQADYMLITHEVFASAPELVNLINLRSSQGLQVMKVDVQDIYDEFNFGISDATAIKDFLAYAWSYWAKVPSVVVLVGDGHYNPKNYSPGIEGFGRTSFIPPYLTMVDATIGETASDNWYVTLEGEDNLPDMLIGRLAVNSIDEVGAFVTKIVDYEASLADGDWNLSVTLAADNPDGTGSFQYSSEYLRSCCIPDYYQQDRAYLGTTHSTTDLARSALIASINDGKLLVNYIGHGAYSEWAGWDSNPALSGPILRASDVAGFTNTGKYPVVLAMTCAEGMFHFPQPLGSFQESMAEVITKAANKGAVASWSPTGWGLATGHDLLDRGFVTAALVDKVNTLGEAATSGLLSLWSSGNYLDLIDTYMIFGDPTLVLKRGLTAISDDYQVNEEEILVVTDAEDVLENDLNPEKLSLTAEFVNGNGPFNGTLTAFNPDGSFSYTPNADFFGTDSFTYRVYDGSNYSNTATVTITVNPINDPPVSDSQTVVTNEDTPIDIILTASDDGGGGGTVSSQLLLPSQYLENQLNEEGLTFKVLDPGPEHGMLSGEAPNLTYTPDSDYNGLDSFTFTVNDGEYDSETATVSITITPVNDAPVMGDIPAQTIAEGETFATISLDNYVSDVDNSHSEITWTYTGNTDLSVNISAQRIATISIPDIDWNGSETITFRATDPGGLFDKDAATFTVTAINDGPVAVNDSYTTSEDTELVVPVVTGVLNNDTDVDGDDLTAVWVAGPGKGSLTLNENGGFTYIPDAGFVGTDSFTYKANDGKADSNIATVTITIIEAPPENIYLPLILR